MTNEEILEIAMRQSATDLSADPQDFKRAESRVVLSQKNEEARRYLSLPFSCQMVSYGNGIVASVSEECRDIATAYIQKYPAAHAFETPHIHILDSALSERGQKICFMAEYFLPDVSILRALDCAYEMRILLPEDFASLYLPEWSNALCEKRRELDRIAIGAYDGGRLIAMAGASADCEDMWQIGIDVLPAYRRKGIASALTSRLAIEILKLGKVPFYCAAWCNLPSVRNAIRSGFRPAWTEMTAKPKTFVDAMNKND